MKHSKLLAFLLCSGIIFLFACNEGVKKDEKPVDIQELTKDKEEPKSPEIKSDELKLTNPLDEKMVATGKATYELKCQSCHRLTEEKLVGPGWKDVTKRREPVWIVNMITDTEMMLDSDPEAQKLLELCMVRMPNQNLTKDQAREVIEFMRKNDGEK